MLLENRASPFSVALETTLLLHGIPKSQGGPLAAELAALCRAEGSEPALIGVYRGVPTVGLSESELGEMLRADRVAKANTANLGVFLHRKEHAATTVATTLELAAGAGLCIFATGGLGGVHKGYADRLDVSADLAALTRFPVAVVSSGVKSLLDVISTRELLESLGVPVVGFRTDRFPAFYLRDGGTDVDATFDDERDLAGYLAHEMGRTRRGVVVCNPIPIADEIPAANWHRWLVEAAGRAGDRGVRGRDVTPFVLSALHDVSGGRTLAANLALVRSNTSLAARLMAKWPR